MMKKEKSKETIEKNDFGADWINANIVGYDIGKAIPTIEKEINQYITLKLESGKTFIYVNGKRFIQCIRLILNIPKEDLPIYDEVDSIDEASELYNKHVFQNRIVQGIMAAPVRNQSHCITPKQEFWGHCSNIQAWAEHDYDTRILMSNISFPLLRELVKAGDPVARKVFKEEIALRLETGYPSVVQYLLNQGYIKYFTPFEFKTIIETTKLIKGLSADPKIMSRFLLSCVSKFPTLVEDILKQVLKLSEGKKIIILSMTISERPMMPYLRPYYRSNPQYLLTLKNGLENLFKKADEKTVEDILDCIQNIEEKLDGQGVYLNKKILENLEDEKEGILSIRQKFLGITLRSQSRCPYCGKVIPKGQDTCEWCGHKKDDDEGGFFPYPFIFKPPGGGDSSMKEAITVPIKIKS